MRPPVDEGQLGSTLVVGEATPANEAAPLDVVGELGGHGRGEGRERGARPQGGEVAHLAGVVNRS